MGYNTTVVVHNDALNAIENDKDFGKNLARAIIHLDITRDRIIDVPAGNYCNAVEIIESHHADNLEAVVVGANAGWKLGYAGHWSINAHTDEGKVQILKNLAEQMGYTLRKKARK